MSTSANPDRISRSGKVSINVASINIWVGSRNSLLINLGGGVIGDMGGFVASTYKRGMDFINIPTTLLAQVDASVGGKLGIDFKGLKNHIGLFREPTQILIDATFMETLPEREIRSGFAEVLKHGLIADKSYWERCNSIDLKYHHQWNDIVERSINIKKGVVNEDPFESGLRKILNFGHTIGHAIETELLHTTDRLLHGEAIAIGMICEAYLSTKMTGLPTKALDQISTSLLELYGHQKIKKSLFNSIIKLALQDKKNKGSVIHCSLLRNIGECAINIPISGPDIIDSLFYYNQLTVHTR